MQRFIISSAMSDCSALPGSANGCAADHLLLSLTGECCIAAAAVSCAEPTYSIALIITKHGCVPASRALLGRGDRRAPASCRADLPLPGAAAGRRPQQCDNCLVRPPLGLRRRVSMAASSSAPSTPATATRQPQPSAACCSIGSTTACTTSASSSSPLFPSRRAVRRLTARSLSCSRQRCSTSQAARPQQLQRLQLWHCGCDAAPAL